MTAALIAPTLSDFVQPRTSDVLKLPTLKRFEGSSWHFCHHQSCRNKGIQPVQFYAVFGSHWRYFCSEKHVPRSLLTDDVLKPVRTRPTTPRRIVHRVSGISKASQCQTDILAALKDGPKAKHAICAGIQASMTRIDTVLRKLWTNGKLVRIALGKRNTHLWYALVEHKEVLQGMVDDLKRQVPVGLQRQTLLDALQSGPKSAQQLAEITGFSLHKIMYTTQALHRMDRIASITSYADLNWFSLPEHRDALVEQAWLSSTDYRVIAYVEAHPNSHTRRIADSLKISFVRAKRILEYAKTFGRVISRTAPNNHTSWKIVGSAQLPLDLGTT